MSAPTPLQRLTSYALEYERAADGYKDIAVESAGAEAEYRSERAKTILRIKAKAADQQERISQAEAETRADATDHIADLYMARLTTAAVSDAARQRLFQLRAMVDVARTVVASDRASDMNHASGFTGAA